MVQAQFHRLQIAEVVAETDQAHSLVFALPDSLRDTFAYRPGQFLTLRVPVDGVPQQRCYSLSSAPEVDSALRVTIKRVQGAGFPTGSATTLRRRYGRGHAACRRVHAAHAAR